MARHQRMPPQEAGYTYAVEPTAMNSILANEEESIYGHWTICWLRNYIPSILFFPIYTRELILLLLIRIPGENNTRTMWLTADWKNN